MFGRKIAEHSPAFYFLQNLLASCWIWSHICHINLLYLYPCVILSLESHYHAFLPFPYLVWPIVIKENQSFIFASSTTLSCNTNYGNVKLFFIRQLTLYCSSDLFNKHLVVSANVSFVWVYPGGSHNILGDGTSDFILQDQSIWRNAPLLIKWSISHCTLTEPDPQGKTHTHMTKRVKTEIGHLRLTHRVCPCPWTKDNISDSSKHENWQSQENINWIGCKYWRRLLSEESHVYWRLPSFIL